MTARRTLFTVGVGAAKDLTLADLEADLERVKRLRLAPGDASIARTAPGSIYALEIIWSGWVDERGQAIPDPNSAGGN